MSIFVRIEKDDCQEITSSQLENGLLEIVAPKNCSDADLNKYLNGLESEFCIIEKQQKKATKIFRKKVIQLIDKYKEELNLNFSIELRLQTKTKKLNNCNVAVHGIMFIGHMTFIAILQYASDDVLEKIVRYTMYDLACQYEQLWSEINEVTMCSFKYPDGEGFTAYSSEIPQEAKYQITISYSELQNIQSEYDEAVKQFCDYMKKNPIGTIR